MAQRSSRKRRKQRQRAAAPVASGAAPDGGESPDARAASTQDFMERGYARGRAKDAEARSIGGPDLLVGLSTHSPAQLEAGIEAGADQLSVGPVWETPTKPGRPATGLDYVRAAAALRPPQPWFAIGSIDGGNVDEVAAAGAERVVVVRAIRAAADPGAAAAFLRAGLEEASLGAAQ